MSFGRYMGALTGSALLVLGANAGYAQNYNAADAVSLSRLSTMSCSQFTHLSNSEQASIVRRMARAAPMQSLSTPLGPSFNTEGKVVTPPGDDSSVKGTPLTPGQLIAACQAVSPRASLRSAFARFNSSTGSPPGNM